MNNYLGIKVKKTKSMGRGLYATLSFPKSQVIHVAETLVFNKKDSKALDNTLLASYVYDAGRGSSCLALGLGSLFNHSSSPNVEYSFKKISGRLMIVYRTLRDIKPDEQLFIDYGYEP